MSEQLIEAPPNKIVLESPEADVDFDQLNDQSKKIDSSYDKQISENIDTITKIKPSEVYKKFIALEVKQNKKEDAKLTLDENPREKLDRIKKEILDFKKQTEFNLQKSKELNANNNLSILKEIQKIENEVQCIAESKGYANFLDLDLKSDGLSLELNFNLLKNEVQNRISERIKQKILSFEKKDENANQCSTTTFEFYLNKETEAIRKIIKMQEFEKKIKRLELLVGINQDIKIESNIVAKVEKINKLAECLNIRKLESLAQNIQTASIEMDNLIGKKAQFSISEEESEQISNLSEKFNKIKIGADELPKLVDRMDSLQNVHEESAELVISANNLQAVQNYILSSVNENKEILLIFKKEFDTNMKTMENNLALLSKRIENLTKK